ncbi:hypothetical protein FBQ85_22975, partial [Cytophagia bacterium CHB2]|nr:hypothetical protein [Cytophagia bacterium CHB2]
MLHKLLQKLLMDFGGSFRLTRPFWVNFARYDRSFRLNRLTTNLKRQPKFVHFLFEFAGAFGFHGLILDKFFDVAGILDVAHDIEQTMQLGIGKI